MHPKISELPGKKGEHVAMRCAGGYAPRFHLQEAHFYLLSCGRNFGLLLFRKQDPGRLAALKEHESTLLTQLVSWHSGAGSPPKDHRVADISFWSMTISLQCLCFHVSTSSDVWATNLMCMSAL